MKNQFRVKSKDYKWLTDCAFSTRKREIILIVDDSVSVYNTFWDGGSKNTYKAVQLETGKTAELITGSSPWNAVSEGKTIGLVPGVAIVKQSVFCGKDMCLMVYIHPDNAVSLLPASPV